MSKQFFILLSGLWLGVFSRLMSPYLRKLYQGKKIKFDIKYLRRTIASLILSTIFTFVLFPRLETSLKTLNFETGFKIFSLAFTLGFGVNSLIMEFNQWFEKKDKL
ncbi:MAG: hypothetical protein NC920_01510 [Candidatus Omnitrophica bacterium]|nr:hypothetical protein [Candidatus Omnitrophota bacterium]MCM8798296.1 hypothetical protein [Candidatus Omnitrophota bacterium]